MLCYSNQPSEPTSFSSKGTIFGFNPQFGGESQKTAETVPPFPKSKSNYTFDVLSGFAKPNDIQCDREIHRSKTQSIPKKPCRANSYRLSRSDPIPIRMSWMQQLEHEFCSQHITERRLISSRINAENAKNGR